MSLSPACRVLLPLLTGLLASGGLALSAWAAMEKPAARPAKETPPAAQPTPATPAPTGKESVKDDLQVILFSAVRSMPDLVQKLPRELVTPQLVDHLGALYSSYRAAIHGVTVAGNPPRLFLLAADGSHHIYDDGKRKGAEDFLNDADMEDMFFYVYPLNNPTNRLPEDFDPGRARPEDFFKMLYGASAEAVRANLVDVEFAGKKLKFSKLHGAAEALAAVAKDLDAAVQTSPELKPWLTNLGGTFNWRNIEGTSRLSAHAYGISIDLNIEESKYWRWEKKQGNMTTFSRKDLPVPIIDAFEAHGFIWGGKWYHYDTMHFEYRPEILHAARQARGGSATPAVTTGKPPPNATLIGEENAAPPPATDRYALLINPMPAAGSKSQASAALKTSLEQCGFKVTLLSGPRLDACIEAVQRASQESLAEAVLFHFSGEAIHHENGIWLVPAGAQITQPQHVHAEALSLTVVVETLAKMKTKSRLVFLDIPPAPGGADESSPTQPQLRIPGFFFGFSAATSAGGPPGWQPEVFTDFLSRRMTVPGMSLSDIFTVLTRDVEQQSNGTQKPISTSTLSEIFRFTSVQPERPVKVPTPEKSTTPAKPAAPEKPAAGQKPPGGAPVRPPAAHPL